MKDVITYVGIDAHKKDLHVAMLIGHALMPVQWNLPNQPAAVARLVASSSGRLRAQSIAVIKLARSGTPCSGS
jgi:hypothetical protein